MDGLPRNTALLIVDVQEGMDDSSLGTRNNPHAEGNIARLLAGWRFNRFPVFHFQHLSCDPESPLRPDQPGVAIKSIVQPQADEPVITKHVNSAFIGTDLEAQLRQDRISALVITGLTTDHCVSTTTRMAGNLGFRTYLVGDATAAFDRVGPDGQRHRAEDVQAISLASLHGEFATVVSTAWVLSQFAQAEEHDG